MEKEHTGMPLLDVAAPADRFKAEVKAWATRIGVEPPEITVRPMTRE